MNRIPVPKDREVVNVETQKPRARDPLVEYAEIPQYLHDRIMAYLDTGRFDLAAERIGCSPDAISDTWHSYRKLFYRMHMSVRSAVLSEELLNTEKLARKQ